mgnify:CR=1 FL=1
MTTTDATSVAVSHDAIRSPLREFWRKFRRNRTAMAAGIAQVLIAIAAYRRLVSRGI